MKFLCLPILLFSLFVPLRAAAWEMYTPTTFDAYVQKIRDGNIIEVNEKKRGGKDSFPVRLYGIGIPQEGQPFAAEAHRALQELLSPGTKIILSTVRNGEEGVISALVQVNDHSVNNRMLEEGLAWVDRSSCKAFFCRRWHIQENLSIKAKKGIWALNMPTPPWQWGVPRKNEAKTWR